MIDIVMTAAVRPDVVKQTLGAARDRLISKHGFRLIVDIAPVGDTHIYTQRDVEEIVQWYFPCHKIRMLPESLQADALRWTWQNAESDWVLQLEDDWVFTRLVDVDEIIEFAESYFDRYARFACSYVGREAGSVLFDRCGKSVTNYPPYYGVFKELMFFGNGWYWRRVKGKSLGGPPALMRREYIEGAIKFMDGITCLDVLSREPEVQQFLSDWEILAYVGEDGKGNLVRDVGKQWKAERGIRMQKRTPKGVLWTNP